MARIIIYSILIVPTMIIGGVIMLRSLGAFGPIAPTPDGPAWLGFLMGLVFFAGSTSALIKLIYSGDDLQRSELPANTPLLARLVYNSFGFIITAGLATLFSWVAFGPGERHFSGSGAFLGATVGRVAFGLGAVMTWAALIWFTIYKLRRGRR